MSSNIQLPSSSPASYENLFSFFILNSPKHIQQLIRFEASTFQDVTEANQKTSTSPSSFLVDIIELFEFDEFLANQLIFDSFKILSIIDNFVLPKIFHQLNIFDKKSIGRRWRSRITHLPMNYNYYKSSVSSIKCEDTGKLVSFAGTITRTGEAKMLEEEKTIECSKCHYLFKVSASPEMHYQLDMPLICPAGNFDAPKIRKFDYKLKKTITKRCSSIAFQALEENTLRTDYQEIRVQELQQHGAAGKVPRVISAILRDDLVNLYQPGEKVLITGVVLQRWKKLKKDLRCDAELFIEANNIQLHPDSAASTMEGISKSLEEDDLTEFDKFWMNDEADEYEKRQQLVDAVCPTLCGLQTAKLALLLTLIGGCPSVGFIGSPESSKRWSTYNPYVDPRGESNGGEGGRCVGARADCHMLYIGEPGTGKSQLLHAVQELSGRHVSTTGMGSSAVGLTCAAVREGGEWMLEAGALVLADGGVCCIDEFSCIRREDRGALHEAMEQQTISVAKAGLVSRLKCRCSVVAATNSITSNEFEKFVESGIPLPLLSRFDLIVVLSDIKLQDEEKTAFILSNEMHRPLVDKYSPEPSSPSTASSRQWTPQRCRLYISYVKTIRPTLTYEAEELISTYYTQLRRVTGGGATSIRSFESIIRLCQAHARLMCHKSVERSDAVCVIWLIETSLNGYRVGAVLKDEDGVGRRGLLDASFFSDMSFTFIANLNEYKSAESKLLHLFELHQNDVHPSAHKLESQVYEASNDGRCTGGMSFPPFASLNTNDEFTHHSSPHPLPLQPMKHNIYNNDNIYNNNIYNNDNIYNNNIYNNDNIYNNAEPKKRKQLGASIQSIRNR